MPARQRARGRRRAGAASRQAGCMPCRLAQALASVAASRRPAAGPGGRGRPAWRCRAAAPAPPAHRARAPRAARAAGRAVPRPRRTAARALCAAPRASVRRPAWRSSAGCRKIAWASARDQYFSCPPASSMRGQARSAPRSASAPPAGRGRPAGRSRSGRRRGPRRDRRAGPRAAHWHRAAVPRRARLPRARRREAQPAQAKFGGDLEGHDGSGSRRASGAPCRHCMPAARQGAHSAHSADSPKRRNCSRSVTRMLW